MDVCVGNAACTWVSQSGVRGTVGVCLRVPGCENPRCDVASLTAKDDHIILQHRARMRWNRDDARTGEPAPEGLRKALYQHHGGLDDANAERAYALAQEEHLHAAITPRVRRSQSGRVMLVRGSPPQPFPMQIIPAETARERQQERPCCKRMSRLPQPRTPKPSQPPCHCAHTAHIEPNRASRWLPMSQ